MKETTFSNFRQFRQKIKAKNPELEAALKEYFKIGGVARMQITSAKEWPELLYPSKKRLYFLIEKKENQKNELLKQRASWNKRLMQANLYPLTNFFKKYSEPVYWKHIAKTVYDADYREDAFKIKLPAHLVADKRWKPMVKTFVESKDYRKQLRLTFEESPIYKKNKKLARYGDQVIDFRKQESTKKIKELDLKIEKIESELKVFKKIISWAK